MAGKEMNGIRDRGVDRISLDRLTRLAKEMSRGDYDRAKKLFELTKTTDYPRSITDLAEAFGMMIVKVESREFKLEQMVEALERSCKELRAAKRMLEGFNRTLEKRVQTRTEQVDRKNSELTKTMNDLKQEVRIRKEAEKKLKQANQELEDTNQKLQEAYLYMRRKKDLLAARQYQESIVFLTNDEGRICGFTDKALELTNRSRDNLLDGRIEEILSPPEGKTFTDLIRQARPSAPLSTLMKIKGQQDQDQICEAKLTRLIVDGKRLIYLVLYKHAGQ